MATTGAAVTLPASGAGQTTLPPTIAAGAIGAGGASFVLLAGP